MNKSALKTTLAAAAIVLSVAAAPAQAESPKISRDTGVGHAIAAQGNAALRMIRAELKAAVKFVKPAPPARPSKVSLPAASAPAGAGASIAATARCAE
jgi:hypothetical protein